MSRDPDEIAVPRPAFPESLLPTESGKYRAFGGSDYFDALIPCLVFRLKDGTRIAKPYHWLGEVEWDPSVGIRLVYTDATLLLGGRNLESLFTAISDQTVRWILEADRPASLTVPECEPLVESVRRDPLRK